MDDKVKGWPNEGLEAAVSQLAGMECRVQRLEKHVNLWRGISGAFICLFLGYVLMGPSLRASADEGNLETERLYILRNGTLMGDFASHDDGVALILRDGNEDRVAILVAGPEQMAGIAIHGPDGARRIEIAVDGKGDPHIRLLDSMGRTTWSAPD